MEKELNIAAILKDKPYAKLWSPIIGECTYSNYYSSTEEIVVSFTNRYGEACEWDFRQSGRTLSAQDTAEVCLFPSKEMRDWSKFAWKKGDVLMGNKGFKVLFDKWANDTYTGFYAKMCNLGFSCYYDTDKYTLAPENEAKSYIKIIEDKFKGKLNLATLKIEKQPEFKDGDFVCISGMGYLAYGIVKSIDNSSKKLEYYVLNDMSTLKFEDWLSFEDKQIQPITETQQIILFDALANENMAWDAEKKAIVGLPKKCEFKVFQKVLVRELSVDEWIPNFYFKRYKDGHKHVMVCGDIYNQCIPYNDSTKHLLGTTDEWKGGEG